MKSTDAMDHRATGKAKFNKKEKREFAIQKAREEEVIDTGAPKPVWMEDPSRLPKAPPRRKVGVR